MGSDPDPSYGSADMSDATLGDFFKRPLKIADLDWSTLDGNFFETFNPWSLYFENPRVINRINNFYNLRSKLHLKFVINGNGFHYGRVIASYKPLPGFDDVSKERPFYNQDVVGASQRPHIYLDPTTSMGGSMVLPFFYFNNALNIPRAEWTDMGRIHMKAIQQLKHANGATDAVRISVFAWTEDLVLSTPTNQNSIALTPQGGIFSPLATVEAECDVKMNCCRKDATDQAAFIPPVTRVENDETKIVLDAQSSTDEYGGAVSGPASALANLAGKLVNVPGIGLYARASQLALSGVANIAALFGYCRPVVIAPIVPYRPAYYGNLSNTNVPDSSTKLTTDIKQETTIDPRTTGLAGVDEMNLKSIITRESYLTSFDWKVSKTSGDRIFTTQVTPYLWANLDAGLSTEIHMTPACHVGQLFRNWRGTMKFRFQVVCSNFHKGRIQIQYDPYDSSGNEFNVAYNKIIDIAEEKDFTVEVGWGIPLCYGTAINPGYSPLPYRLGSGGLPFPINEQDMQNGQLSIWVLNDLTVPASDIDNDIQINLFVACGDNMEFANPTDEAIETLVYMDPAEPFLGASIAPKIDKSNILMDERATPLDPQSAGLNAPDQDHSDDPSRPMDTSVMPIMAADISDTDGLNSICFGEKIVSVRSLLKRFTLHSFYAVPRPLGGGNRIYKRRSCNFPYYRGRLTDGIHTAGPYPYNFVKTTPLTYMTPCYEGWRGGLRKKTLVSTNPGASTISSTMQITRLPRPGKGFEESTRPLVLNDTASYVAADNLKHLTSGFAGTAITPCDQNPVLEVEFPYHHPERFVPAKRIRINGFGKQYSNIMHITVQNSSNFAGPYMIDTVAVADDFSLFFYSGAPTMYYAPFDPSP